MREAALLGVLVKREQNYRAFAWRAWLRATLGAREFALHEAHAAKLQAQAADARRQLASLEQARREGSVLSVMRAVVLALERRLLKAWKHWLLRVRDGRDQDARDAHRREMKKVQLSLIHI